MFLFPLVINIAKLKFLLIVFLNSNSCLSHMSHTHLCASSTLDAYDLLNSMWVRKKAFDMLMLYALHKWHC